MRSVCEILKQSKNIAVVGLSDKPGRDSRNIAGYLSDNGYNVIGVNPLSRSDVVDGIRVVKSLEDVPFRIDIVDVFRRSELIPELLPDILSVKPAVVWLQLGIENNDAMELCENNGIETIQNKCIYIEHRYCK